MHCRMGTVVVELYWRHAPKTCKNFAELARRGYYTNTKFHRIIKEFMVQGGDPTGTGRFITYTILHIHTGDRLSMRVCVLFICFSCFVLVKVYWKVNMSFGSIIGQKVFNEYSVTSAVS